MIPIQLLLLMLWLSRGRLEFKLKQRVKKSQESRDFCAALLPGLVCCASELSCVAAAMLWLLKVGARGERFERRELWEGKQARERREARKR